MDPISSKMVQLFFAEPLSNSQIFDGSSIFYIHFNIHQVAVK
jgi:hypothetical protein